MRGAFVFAVTILFGILTLTKVLALASSEDEKRRPYTAFDVVLFGAIAVWGSFALVLG